MPNEREQFRPVLDRDVMLNILADHVRSLPRKEQESIAKNETYQKWAEGVATRSFDYGYKIFKLTQNLNNGDQGASTGLYLTYVSLLTEFYRESFDCVQFIPGIPENVKTFLTSAPSTFEPVPTPEPDFLTVPNFNFTPDERFFDQKIKNTLATITNLITRGLSTKHVLCTKLLPVRINAALKDLVKVAMELIAGYRMILLFGASEPATTKAKKELLSKFFNEADKLRILDYMAEGKMFSDDAFEKNKKAKEAYLLMTGLFDLQSLYL